jgi:hypothetical protein
VAAKVSCKHCIENGKWKHSLADAENNVEALIGGGGEENEEGEEIGDGCKVCGSLRTVTFGHRDFHETQVDDHRVTETPMKEFVHWLLNESPENCDTYVFSHYGGKFDMHYIYKELYKEGLNPSMLRRGNKLYDMKVEGKKGMCPKIIFRDSYNLLNMPLARLVPSFELDVQEKPFFPYKANHPDNYGIKMLQLPPKEEYLYAGFMRDKKKAFDDWYSEHQSDQFLLDEALAAYCCNDVDILMAALVVFRREFMDFTKREADKDGFANREGYKTPHEGIDPLKVSIFINSN